MTKLERALAGLVGGYDGGWSLWQVALTQLERSVSEGRDDGEARFRSYPAGELNRLLVKLQDALQVAELAVELQATLNDDPDGPDRDGAVERLLLERARRVAGPGNKSLRGLGDRG